mgnify:CR=1 FL=1
MDKVLSIVGSENRDLEIRWETKGEVRMAVEKFTFTPSSLDVVEKVNEIIDSLSTADSSAIYIGPNEPEAAQVWIEVSDFVAVSGNGVTVSETEPTVDTIVWIEV